jgi:hypothetical protein
MSERIAAELELIRSHYPRLDFREADRWASIPDYPLPTDWGRGKQTEIAFQVPADLFAQEPYGFWVRPPLQLPGGGDPSNSSGPVSTGFGEGWQQFSWSPDGWRPGPELRSGTNLLDFVCSFASRLREIN